MSGRIKEMVKPKGREMVLMRHHLKCRHYMWLRLVCTHVFESFAGKSSNLHLNSKSQHLHTYICRYVCIGMYYLFCWTTMHIHENGWSSQIPAYKTGLFCQCFGEVLWAFSGQRLCTCVQWSKPFNVRHSTYVWLCYRLSNGNLLFTCVY